MAFSACSRVLFQSAVDLSIDVSANCCSSVSVVAFVPTAVAATVPAAPDAGEVFSSSPMSDSTNPFLSPFRMLRIASENLPRKAERKVNPDKNASGNTIRSYLKKDERPWNKCNEIFEVSRPQKICWIGNRENERTQQGPLVQDKYL